ncbi:ribonuclease P protein subunit p29 isoform X2 [Muntiacus reevesi]
MGAQRAEAFVRAFLRRSIPRMSQQALEDHLQRKAVVLEYFTHRKQKEKRKKSKGLSAKQRRELRLFDIKPEQQRYSLFLPLHELWKQYIRDLCNGLKPDTQPQMIQAKLLKADLHGAIVSVTKSKCPSYVGVTGILLQETKHVFKIITKEDRLKGLGPSTCPKAAASQRIAAREAVGRKPRQRLPLEFPEPAPWDPGKRVPAHLPVVLTALAEEHLVCQDSHTPTLPTNPEISKPQWGLFLLFLTLGFLAACFYFPIYSSVLILNLRKWCTSFPRKHKAMSLSASYVARPVSGTFSGSF